MVGRERTYSQGNRAVSQDAYAKGESLYPDPRLNFFAGFGGEKLFHPWFDEHATCAFSVLDDLVALGKTSDAQFSQGEARRFGFGTLGSGHGLEQYHKAESAAGGLIFN